MEIKRIFDRLDYIEAQLDFLILTVIYRSKKMSASIEEINAEMATIKTTIEAERTQVQDALAVQAAKIAELTALLGGVVVPGSVVTSAQLDALLVAAKDVTAAVANIYTPAA